VATPHPKKSMSSVQMAPERQRRGQNRPVFWISRAEPLSIFSFRRAINVATNQFDQMAQGTQQRERFSGSPLRLMTSVARCSSASWNATSGTKNDTFWACASSTCRTRFPKTARTRILESTLGPYLAFRLFSRATRRISL